VALLTDDQEFPLFLQFKEARRSVLADYVKAKSRTRHEGQRVVEGQRLMQSASDLFLGWTTGPHGRHFYVRQLRDMKISAELENFDAETFAAYARVCGRALARPRQSLGQCGGHQRLYRQGRCLGRRPVQIRPQLHRAERTRLRTFSAGLPQGSAAGTFGSRFRRGSLALTRCRALAIEMNFSSLPRSINTVQSARSFKKLRFARALPRAFFAWRLLRKRSARFVFPAP
jgi:hypothetical protein